MSLKIIGAGLAGCEAAWQAAQNGVEVELYEMKAEKKSPAHTSDCFAELVCSNSLRAASITNAVGLLKQEMRELSSLIMLAADECAVPAGGALAVDRVRFSRYITNEITNHKNIKVISREVTDITSLEGNVIVAAGPLASEGIADSISELIGGQSLRFFDAAAPIVSADSVDMSSAYIKSRYDKGTPDYVNCPLDKQEYENFVKELLAAECAEMHGFEHNVFEGCMPVEEMAQRGLDTLRFGPMKPVGLRDPKTGKEPYAVVQLRKENREGTMYNLVGFQTRLKFPEQRRVFGLIPALKNAEYQRYGVMHANTFLRSPGLLDANYRLISQPRIFFAGQITGVEGYVESAASGLYAGLSAAAQEKCEELPKLGGDTAIGALARYVSASPSDDFQPMNITFGLIDPSDRRFRKKTEKNEYISKRALEKIRAFADKGESHEQ